jgi:hypothetical protein
MSSETSIDVLPPKGGSSRTGGSHGGAAEDQTFQVSHFFVLLSLLAATVAVLMARPSAPANLILISLTIGAAGLAALAVYRMFAPLVAPRTDLDRQPLSERMRLDLEREKALTLRSIKELEFDRAMGKVSGQDFEDMAARLRARALGIMRQLDEGSHAYRALIEKELAQRVGKVKVDLPPESELPPNRLRQGFGESAEAFRATAEGGSDRCLCGTRNDADARFCKSCGSKLGTA